MRHFSVWSMAIILTGCSVSESISDIDTAIRASTEEEWRSAEVDVSIMLSEAEWKDFVEASISLREAFESDEDEGDGEPLIYGMSARQVVITGLSLRKQQFELIARKSDPFLNGLEQAYLASLKEDDDKSELRSEFLDFTQRRFEEAKAEVARMEARIEIWISK